MNYYDEDQGTFLKKFEKVFNERPSVIVSCISLASATMFWSAFCDSEPELTFYIGLIAVVFSGILLMGDFLGKK